MRTTIDIAGRLVIPKRLRKAAGLEPGASLDVRFANGRIEIEPCPLTVRTEKHGRFLVAVPLGPVSVLTAETVEKTRRTLEEETAADRVSSRRRLRKKVMPGFLPDTSCMVAAVCPWHEHHDRARERWRGGSTVESEWSSPDIVWRNPILF